MGADQRMPNGALIDKLAAQPYRFDFYQAVSLLEHATLPCRPVGLDGYQHEAVRFRGDVSLGFPPSDVIAVALPDDVHAPALVTTAVMGLAGAHGPLPVPFTEMVLQHNSARKYAARDLLDIFNHRFLSFLYRARRKHRLALSRQMPEHSEPARYLRALTGMAQGASAAKRHDAANPLLRYAGLFTGGPRSMASLEALLAAHFGVQVRGEQMVGKWLDISPAEWSRIGRSSNTRNALGSSTLVGKRTWDQRAGIRLHLSGLSLARLGDFLPGERDFAVLTGLTRRFLQESFDVEVWLEVEHEAVKPAALGKGAGLGWNAWLPAKARRNQPVRLMLPVLA